MIHKCEKCESYIPYGDVCPICGHKIKGENVDIKVKELLFIFKGFSKLLALSIDNDCSLNDTFLDIICFVRYNIQICSLFIRIIF